MDKPLTAEDIAGILYHAADIIKSWNGIQTLPSCNDCGRQPHCSYCPKPGQMVRYNCILWSKDGHDIPASWSWKDEVADETIKDLKEKLIKKTNDFNELRIKYEQVSEKIFDIETEKEHWHNLCQSYEQTITKMAEAIAKRDGA